MDDRTLHVPPHKGSSILPCHPLFNRLLRFAHDRPPRLCVRDVNAGTEATHLQLLTDVIALRERLRSTLSRDVLDAIDRRDEVYLAVLAGGGYEYTVGMLGVLALGAAVVPMTVALPPEEALYYATKSRAAAVLVSSPATKLGVALEKLVKGNNPQSHFTCIPIAPSTFSPLLATQDILVSSDLYLDDNGPGVVIFTSGTTGPPKGAVMRRGYTFDGALSVADHYGITKDDVQLHLLPVHHATGVGIMFFPFLLSGALTEYKSGSFDAGWTWDRWKRGGLTFFSGVPTIYMRMMRYFQQNIEHRQDAQQYVDGARALRACLCGTSALPKPIADFWTQILGKKIMLRYGATEFGAVFKVRLGDDIVPDGSVGEKFPGVQIRLSEGDEGEVLIKSSEMFSKYIFDPDATAKAHTEDGFYKSGDIARREGQYYWIMGRASVDIIKSGGYKISALDIEREILALPYVSEVMVVGVPDDEFGQRVAAAICLKNDFGPEYAGKNATPESGVYVTIRRLRNDLRARLAGYKMPTLLRIVEGELPKSATGKVAKKALGPFFFPENYRDMSSEIQGWLPGEPAAQTKAKL